MLEFYIMFSLQAWPKYKGPASTLSRPKLYSWVTIIPRRPCAIVGSGFAYTVPRKEPCSFHTLTFQSLLVTWYTNSLTFNNCTLCPHCIYVFCIYLRTNSDLCHLQHKVIGFYNRDEKCLQHGTDWVFKCSSLHFICKGLNTSLHEGLESIKILMSEVRKMWDKNLTAPWNKCFIYGRYQIWILTLNLLAPTTVGARINP